MDSPLSLSDFVDLGKALHGARMRDLSPFAYVGKALGVFVEALLDELGVGDEPKILGKVMPGAYIAGRVYIGEGAVVEPGAYIQGPTYVAPGAEIRHAAYVRGQVYVGPKAVVGHTSEVKGSLLFDHAKAAHFAYVGDSVLGLGVNLGAGTKLANLPLRRAEVRVKHPLSGTLLGTGLDKFGAVMGDGSQTGCNAVLSPGTLLMPRTAVMPCVHYRGTLVTGIAR